MEKKYIIFAPSYDEKIGGVIVLHKLCSELNEMGYEAYLYPSFNTFELNEKEGRVFKTLRRYFKEKRRRKKRPYKTNPSFNTPVYKEENTNFDENFVVIYPEVTFGNPLNGSNIVRWLLHNPGHLTNKIYYGKNELYFRYQEGFEKFEMSGSKTSDTIMTIIDFPTNLYNENNIGEKKGIAYCLRKGKHKEIKHEVEGSILIDGKSHEEIAKIFKKVKTFISYDNYTAYSQLAALCGCTSIVIPDEGVTKEKWQPNPYLRLGIAYGMDQKEIKKANETSYLVKNYIQRLENENKIKTAIFIKEINDFFEK